MGRIDIRLHFIMLDKGIIDPGIDGGSVVNIYDGGAGSPDTVRVVVPVIKSGTPLKIGVQRMERGDQQIEIVMRKENFSCSTKPGAFANEQLFFG